MSDETVVREAWERVSIGQPTTTEWDGEYRLIIAGNVASFIDLDAAGCWSAARKFTDKRREEIRKVREEIAVQSEFCQHGDECGLCQVVARTVARLQAALEELLKGWRCGYCGGIGEVACSSSSYMDCPECSKKGGK